MTTPIFSWVVEDEPDLTKVENLKARGTHEIQLDAQHATLVKKHRKWADVSADDKLSLEIVIAMSICQASLDENWDTRVFASNIPTLAEMSRLFLVAKKNGFYSDDVEFASYPVFTLAMSQWWARL